MKKVILLVDDEKNTLTSITLILRREGFDVMQAGSAGTAIELLAITGDEIDLIITDLNMPGISGNEVVKAAFARKKKIPVIVISGFLDRPGKEELLRMGCAAVIEKPFEAEKLIEEVKKII